MREEALCVRQIVKKYLKDNGYDGLWCDECACVTDDIAPCGHIGEDCEAGYKRTVPPDESCGCCGQGCEHWHIEPKGDAGGDAVKTREQALAALEKADRLGQVIDDALDDEAGGTVGIRCEIRPLLGQQEVLFDTLRDYLVQPGGIEQALAAVRELELGTVECSGLVHSREELFRRIRSGLDGRPW